VHRRARSVGGVVLACSLALGSVAGCADEPRDDAAPQSQGTVPPLHNSVGSVPGAVPSHPLGVKWSWMQPETFQFLTEVPGGSTFYEVEWCAVERRPGMRNWSRVDSVVDRTKELGFELMLKIRVGGCWTTGSNPSPKEAQEGESPRNKASSYPAHEDVYETFLRALVLRYAERGVHLYAVENEIDALNFWQADVEEYDRLVRLAADVIKSADPEAIVYDGGVSSTAYGVAMAAEMLEAGREREALDLYNAYYTRRTDGDGSRFPAVADVPALREVVQSSAGIRAREALRLTFALASAGVVDAYQLHYYEPAELAPTILDWIKAHVPANTKIDAWEAGVAWPGADYDEAGHAAQAARLFGELLRGGVRRVVYLPLAYSPAPNKTQIFRGLLDPDGQELPAAATYRELIRLTSDAVVETLDVGSVHGIVAEHDGRAIALVWGDGTGELPADPETGLAITDSRGESIPSVPRPGARPLLVEIRGSAEDLRARLADALPA
jgi:hypothetical protein